MKVLFVYPDVSGSFSHSFHYGIGYLGAILEQAGHDIDLIHAKKEQSYGAFIAKIQEYNPDLVAISATTPQFPYARKYAQWSKSVSSCPIICGGVHPTLVPDEVIAISDIDVVCLGEGEQPLLEYVNALSRGADGSNIENLWLKQGGLIIKNRMRRLNRELDLLPNPTRKFDSEISISRVGDIMAGRGCPYNCTYCCNHSIKKIYPNGDPYVRYRSVKNVLAEIDDLIRNYHVQSLDFHDDTFTLNRKWLTEFCFEYQRRFKIPFVCNGRPETLNKDVLELLKDAGCKLVRIGVESGSERVRQEILGRNISDVDLRRVFKDAKDVGLQTSSFNMMGVPGETTEDLDRTIALNRELRPDRAVVSVFYPYPLTRLYQECVENGLLTDRQKCSHTDLGTTLDLPDLSEKQINRAVRRFRAYFYKYDVAYRSPKKAWIYQSLEICFGAVAARAIWMKSRWCGFRLKEFRQKIGGLAVVTFSSDSSRM